MLGLLVGLVGPLGVGCDKGDKLKGPEAEVHKSDLKLNLPAVPAFDLPPAPTDGSHTVKEMRVKGKKLLETEITVKGIITWTYDCPTAIRQPGMSDKDLQKMIDEDPSRCERPKFYIGDAADTPAEKSLWVVEGPAAVLQDRARAAAQGRAAQPAGGSLRRQGSEWSTCPPYKVGDQVEITGTWRLTSPHSERNSDGLLVYKRMKNVTANWESPIVEPKPGQPAPAAPTRPSPQDLVNKSGKSSG